MAFVKAHFSALAIGALVASIVALTGFTILKFRSVDKQLGKVDKQLETTPAQVKAHQKAGFEELKARIKAEHEASRKALDDRMADFEKRFSDFEARLATLEDITDKNSGIIEILRFPKSTNKVNPQ